MLEKGSKDPTPKLLAVLAMVGFLAYIFMVTLQAPEANDDAIVNLVLGYLGGWLLVLPVSTLGVATTVIDMERLIEQLKRHEGVRNHAYKDIGGIWHIGAGRNIDPNPRIKGWVSVMKK